MLKYYFMKKRNIINLNQKFVQHGCIRKINVIEFINNKILVVAFFNSIKCF